METKQAKETVLAFLKAINEEDWETAKKLTNDNFTFDGVMAARNGSEAYFKDMERMKLKYNIRKVFADGSDVCVLCDIDMGGGKTIFTCGWYHLKYNKLYSLKVVFDPRPIL